MLRVGARRSSQCGAHARRHRRAHLTRRCAGFPPFSGGPFRHIDRVGVSKYVDTLNQLADKHGERFKPAPLLVDYAKAGRKFYP